MDVLGALHRSLVGKVAHHDQDVGFGLAGFLQEAADFQRLQRAGVDFVRSDESAAFGPSASTLIG